MTNEQIIKHVLKEAGSKKRDKIETEWLSYLDEHLQFPFEAKIHTHSWKGSPYEGQRVKVIALHDCVDLYGMIMEVKIDRETKYFSLSELELIDKKSQNYQIIDAYFDWEGNY